MTAKFLVKIVAIRDAMSIIHLNNVKNYTFSNSSSNKKLKMQCFYPVIQAEDFQTAEVW
jgi:hypothetical protein